MAADGGSAEKPPVVVLSGPTASGKTAASVRLARALDAEIVSVDSGLVYRGLDIGTAKPTLAERGGVVHHLIDVRDPWDPYSAAEFVADATRLIGEIAARGRRALLVGGTLLYVRALQRGLAPLPPADPVLRAEIAREADRRGWPALHAGLARVDPLVAARVHPNDPQRLQRAIEVYRLTGEPLGELQRRTVPPLDVPPLVLALVPGERRWLHERIARRLTAMCEAGLLEEVRALRADPRVTASLPAMRSVGYRQAWEHLERVEPSASGPRAGGAGTHRRADSRPDPGPDPAWTERALFATRQLAKRQLTWLRGMPGLHAVPCDTLDDAARHAALLAILKRTGVTPS